MIISTEQQAKNEFNYLASVMLLRQIYENNNIDLDLLEKLNELNAETFGCRVLPIKY